MVNALSILFTKPCKWSTPWRRAFTLLLPVAGPIWYAYYFSLSLICILFCLVILCVVSLPNLIIALVMKFWDGITFLEADKKYGIKWFDEIGINFMNWNPWSED